ncbi:hypothetical protein GDO81_028522 [Engystomops pustulosus]|uniref:Uncharacterized protein n=1 Tax=Engystomops pustulosus TaxID=76066 RepID=A0AAV6Z2W5_ENGPU|nr:hypothetical protein GDO81_028522 [Engystomops pustulosus]
MSVISWYSTLFRCFDDNCMSFSSPWQNISIHNLTSPHLSVTSAVDRSITLDIRFLKKSTLIFMISETLTFSLQYLSMRSLIKPCTADLGSSM